MALITEVPLEQQALDQVILFQAAPMAKSRSMCAWRLTPSGSARPRWQSCLAGSVR
jgi:hypothetical protein